MEFMAQEVLLLWDPKGSSISLPAAVSDHDGPLCRLQACKY